MSTLLYVFTLSSNRTYCIHARVCLYLFAYALLYEHTNRGVQDNDRYLREAWFMDVRACRRRVQGSITNAPISRMFAIPDEHHLVDYRATISAVKKHLKVST
jgi:hypothetical protein